MQLMEITEAEREKILKNVFLSLEPPVLKVYSSKEKKKQVTLAFLAGLFEADTIYTERQVNERLAAVWPNFATLRRALVDYGFLSRTRDCSRYQRT